MSFETLRQAAIGLEDEYQDEGAEVWEGSPFAWIRDHKSATVGAIGRNLVASIFTEVGLPLLRVHRQFEVNGHTVASKFSMEWTAGGFVFEQIKDTNYEYLLCLGLQPEAAFGWLLPKADLIEEGTWRERDGLRPQHTGIHGQETAWLTINPEAPPHWLQDHGGTIAQLETRLLSRLI